MYENMFFDRALFTQFFQKDARFPPEVDLYCSMAAVAGDYTKNIFSKFGQTISGIKNKLAIFKAISERVSQTTDAYDAAVVELLESISGPHERRLVICTKFKEEGLISDKHFAFVVDKMFA